MRFLTKSLPLLFLTALPCLCAGGAEGQDERTSMKAVRVEVGYSSNHRGSDTGIGGSLRFVLSNRGNEAVRQEAGVILGTPYLGLDYGVELRVPGRTPVAFVVRIGLGLLLEDGYIGPYLRGGGGLEWTLGPRLALRVTSRVAAPFQDTRPAGRG